MSTPNPVPNMAVWFEIPATDIDRAIRFYETVLAAELTRTPCPSTDMRMGVFPHYDAGGVSGCVIQGDGYAPGASGSIVYLNGGDDLAVPLARVEAAGGTVLIPKTLINDEIGYFAHVIDSEGNRVGLHSRR